MRKHTKRVLSFLLMAIVTTLLLSACNDDEGSSDSDTIKIGAVLPMTGGAAVFGDKFNNAYSMAIEEINEAGGVKGKKLELVIEDSQEKPDVGKVATESLVSNKDVLVLTGGRSSGVTLQEAQVADENSIPYLIDHGTSDLATMSDYEYVFRMNPTAGMYPDTLVDYLKENPPTGSIAYINVDNAFGEAIYEYGLEAYFEDSGVENKVFKYTAGELDFSQIMTSVKAMGPEILIMTAGDDNDATQIMKAAHEAKIDAGMLIGTAAGHSILGFYEQAGELTESVVVAGPWHGDKSDPKWQAFNDKYIEKHGQASGEHEVEGYAAIYVIADALERAEELTRESVKEALKETDLKTIFGQVKFEDFDGYKNQNKGITSVTQWIDGEMHTVYPLEIAEREIVPFKGW